MQVRSRNFGLDIIRAISIALVVASHTFVTKRVDLGVWGVEIFFVLSGFLIGQILIRDFSNGITFEKIAHFWKRRWFRTLPLYYAIIIIKFLFFDSSLRLKIFAYIFFLQNNFVGVSFFPVSWSLVVEEWFYILLPVLLLLFFKKGFNKNKLLFFLTFLILFLLGMRYFWVLYTNKPFEAIRPNFPFRFDSLLIGVLLAHLKLNYTSIYLKIANPLICMLGILLMIYLAFDLGPLGSFSTAGVSHANEFIWYRTGWFSAFSFSIFLLIPFMENSKHVANISKWKIVYLVITWTSVLTYSIYLIHLFVFKVPLSFESTIINNTVYILLLYLVSYIIYKYFEHPMMELRDRKILFSSR